MSDHYHCEHGCDKAVFAQQRLSPERVIVPCEEWICVHCLDGRMVPCTPEICHEHGAAPEPRGNA